MGRRTTSTLQTGNLTNQQKLDICKHASANPSKSQRGLCVWAKIKFNLAKSPCQATISNALKKRKYPELDRALANWVLHCTQTTLRVTGDLIKLKAERFAKLLGIEDKCSLSFSNWWLCAFKERHGFKSRQCFGEAASVSHKVVEDALPGIVELARQYKPVDIYNFDETGLFYQLAPDRAITSRSVRGAKKCKTRITITFAVNADGTDKREPLFIGTALRPRCFNKKLGFELGFCYENNKKAWMDGLVFQRWLKLFDRSMADAGRHVLLLLDNASSHTVAGLELTSVQVLFLPPNTTPELQPLDAGIVSSFERRYRRQHLEHALYQDEQGEKNIYTVNQLRAMRWAKQCWMEIAPSDDALPNKKKPKAEQELEDRITQCMESLRISEPMTLEEILNPAEENDAHVGNRGEDYAAVAIELEGDLDDAGDVAVVEISDEEKLGHLTQAIRILDSLGCSNSTRKELRAAQRSVSAAIRDRKRQRILQPSLRSFFQIAEKL